jgi:hypothetical protein
MTGEAMAISKVAPLSIPLSRPIDDVLVEVNFDAESITKAVAIVHENKLFCALPVTEGTDQDCTIVMVYDFLLQAWVSRDIFPDGFVIDNFVKTSFGASNTKSRLFIVNGKGWSLYGETQIDDSGRTIGTDGVTTTAIPAKLVTRNYTMQNTGVKRFMTGQVASIVSQNDSFNVKAHTTEPDATSDTITIDSTTSEEMLSRFGIRSRGYSASVEINVSAGRPTFRHVVVEGSSLVLGARSEEIR